MIFLKEAYDLLANQKLCHKQIFLTFQNLCLPKLWFFIHKRDFSPQKSFEENHLAMRSLTFCNHQVLIATVRLESILEFLASQYLRLLGFYSHLYLKRTFIGLCLFFILINEQDQVQKYLQSKSLDQTYQLKFF